MSATPELLSLVCDIIISQTQDFELLKTLRLICKPWNKIASEALRKKSFVLMDERSPARFKDLKALLMQRRSLNPDVASPFEDYHVIATSFTGEIFNELLRLPEVKITSLKFSWNDAVPFDYLNFMYVLAWKGGSVTDLTIAGGNMDVDRALCPCGRLLLTSLKRLSLSGICGNTLDWGKTQFVKTVMQWSRLEGIQISTSDPSKTVLLFSNDSVRNLKELELNFDVISTEAWDLLGNLNFPQLKKLGMLTMGGMRTVTQPEQFASFIRNISRVMEEFTGSLSLERNAVYQNLRRVYFYNWDYDFGMFSPRRFPALKKVNLGLQGNVCAPLDPTLLVPHQGVKELGVVVGPASSDTILRNMVRDLGKQFPGVTSLDISVSASRSGGALHGFDVFRCVSSAFLRLKKFRVDRSCNFTEIRARPEDYVQSYTNFRELQTLSLGPSVRVTNDLIILCLAKFPALKALEFHWNGFLAAEVVCQFLRPLNVRIYRSGARGENLTEADQNVLRMSGVQLV